MPLKNLNLVEKYLEKVVLAVGILFAILVTWFYVIGSPYSVEIKAVRRVVAPSEIEPLVLDELRKLEQLLRPDSPSQLPPMNIPPYTEEFRRRHGSPLLAVDRFEIPFSEFGLALGTDGPRTPDVYHVPAPPAPTALKYITGFGVLAEPKPELVEAFEDQIGSQNPRDFTWVSVSAEFDLRKWREALSSRPPEGTALIPEQWWRGNQVIVDVVLLKQIYDVEQGKWGEVQTLRHVPGNELFQFFGNEPLSFREGRTNWAPAEADGARTIAIQNDRRLARPSFPTLKEGLWLPPDADPNLMNPNQRAEFESLVAEINRLQKQIKAGGRDPAAGDAATAQPVDLKTLNSQLERALKQLDVLIGIEEADYAAEGMKVTAAPGLEPAGGGGFLDPAGPAAEDVDSGRDTIKIWQHDVTVKPGQTVRYAMVANILNPLFFQATLSAEQRKAFYNKVSIASVQSAWTDPILVQSEHAFYLVGADEGRKQVTLEVYCIFNGQWQMQEFAVNPGNPVGGIVRLNAGGADRQVNMNVGALLIDVDFDAPAQEGIAGGKTTRIIYYDQATGALLQRYLDQDKDDSKRLELRNKALSNRVAGL